MLKEEIFRLTPLKTHELVRKQFDQLNYFLKDKRANTDWLLLVISKLEPEHEFFSLNYRPLKRTTVTSKFTMDISDEDNFFAGVDPKNSKRGNTSMFATKEDKLAHKMAFLTKQQETI